VQISGARIHLATFPFYFPHQQRIKCEVIGAIYIRVCGGDKTGTARPPLCVVWCALAVYAAALLRKNINFAALFFCGYTPHGKLCATSLFILEPFFVSGDKTAETFFTCSALQSHPQWQAYILVCLRNHFLFGY